MKKSRKLNLGKITIASVEIRNGIRGGSILMEETAATCIYIHTEQQTCAASCADTCGINCNTLSPDCDPTIDTLPNGHTLGCPPPLG